MGPKVIKDFGPWPLLNFEKFGFKANSSRFGQGCPYSTLIENGDFNPCETTVLDPSWQCTFTPNKRGTDLETKAPPKLDICWDQNSFTWAPQLLLRNLDSQTCEASTWVTIPPSPTLRRVMAPDNRSCPSWHGKCVSFRNLPATNKDLLSYSQQPHWVQHTAVFANAYKIRTPTKMETIRLVRAQLPVLYMAMVFWTTYKIQQWDNMSYD